VAAAPCRAVDNARVHYQHRFHAGNFADVFKHVLLLALLRALGAKDKPWCYAETHAGAGDYDLADEAAARTAEFHDGIARLWSRDDAPPAVADYLDRVRALNPDGSLRRYPGSPRVALQAARAQDRLLLCERVPAVVEQLRSTLGADPRVHVHRRDGYELTALLPPPEKRGLVLVDPPFERADEFDACADFLAAALRRFGGGVFAVWYPLKQRHATERWLRRVRRELSREALNLQLSVSHAADGEMRACGLLVVNPPFAFRAPAQAALAWLAPLLAQGAGAGFDIDLWE
jgi:23S rRNA (adenine2030-N6)-methyltransferase